MWTLSVGSSFFLFPETSESSFQEATEDAVGAQGSGAATASAPHCAVVDQPEEETHPFLTLQQVGSDSTPVCGENV